MAAADATLSNPSPPMRRRLQAGRESDAARTVAEDDSRGVAGAVPEQPAAAAKSNRGIA
jgi:hypothetical protein